MQDHGALIGHQRLELGRKNIELANPGERHRVVGQSADRHILNYFLQTGLTRGVFHVPGL